jgi:hypothetical protein
MTTAMVSLVGVPAQLRRPSRGTALWWPRGNSPRCYEAIPDFARAYGMGSFSNQHHDLDVTWDLHWFAQSRGLLVVRKAAAGGGMILDGDPAEWLSRVPDKLRERHVSPDQWVLSLSTCLSPTVRHPFWWHFGPILERPWQALVATTFPFTAPLAKQHVVFEAVSFEAFWPWMLGRYLWQAHLHVSRSMWHALRTSSWVPCSGPRSTQSC